MTFSVTRYLKIFVLCLEVFHIPYYHAMSFSYIVFCPFLSTMESLYVHGECYGFLVLLRMVIAYTEEMLCVGILSASIRFSSFNPYNRTSRWRTTVTHKRKLKQRKVTFSVALPAN